MSLSLLQSYSSAEDDEENSIDPSDEESKSIDQSDEETTSLKYKSALDFPDPQQSDTRSARSALPSAFDAFSEVTGPPRFLNNAAGEEEIVSPEIADHRRKRNRKRSFPAGVVVEAKAELVGMHERVRSDVEGSKSTAAIVERRKAAENKEMEKKTVKDKEKSKRMRGQSSHATWKSETEMQLRQHFD